VGDAMAEAEVDAGDWWDTVDDPPHKHTGMGTTRLGCLEVNHQWA